MAVVKGDEKIVDILLKNGADPKFILKGPYKSAKNLLDLARSNTVIKEMLIKAKAIYPKIIENVQHELPEHPKTEQTTQDQTKNLSVNKELPPSPKYYAKVVPDSPSSSNNPSSPNSPPSGGYSSSSKSHAGKIKQGRKSKKDLKEDKGVDARSYFY